MHSRAILPRRVAIAASLLILLTPRLAAAHAILEESEPPQDGSVPAGKIALRFRYNSRIDAGRSRLTLIRPDKSQTALDIVASSKPDILQASPALTPGVYTVRWQVLAIDGHITRGDVRFTVTGP